MPARFVFDSADIICKPLTHIINHLSSQESFLATWKKPKLLQYTRKKQKLTQATIDRYQSLTLWVLSNLSVPVPCVLSNFRCKLVKSNSSLKIIITLKVFNILTSSHGISISEMLFTLCIVYTSLCDLRPSYYHVAISLYSVVVLEKNRTRSTIFKSILEQLRKIFDRTT